jgi:photosystem II stability/assembly factor-like uncharacterized protein
VLREALCADPCEGLGIYFGTRRGDIYFSADDGKNWSHIAEGLPPVLSVNASQVGRK